MILFMWICGVSKRYFTEKGTKKRIKKTSFYIRKRREDLTSTEVREEKNIEIEKKGKVEIKVELEEKKTQNIDNN